MADLSAYERDFRRAGLPLLIEDYTAREDIFTRAVPLLTLVFVAEMLGAVSFDFSFLGNVGAALGGLAILLGGFGLVNRLRGRSLLERPHDVGLVELATFVLLPAVLPLVFSGQTTSALATAAGNLALLGMIYLVVGYGLFSIVRWALGRLFGQLAASLNLLTRAVPLLLIFALVLFVNTEMWQVFSELPRSFMGWVAGLIVGLGLVFLAFRLPREVRALEREAGGAGPALDRRQRINVGLVMLVSQGLQILVVSLAVAAFFVAFGALAIGPEVRESWIGSNGNVLFTINLLEDPIQITEQLLRVSSGIALFSGLYYAIAVLTDSTYREEFLDELTDELRTTFHAREEYLAARGSASAPA